MFGWTAAVYNSQHKYLTRECSLLRTVQLHHRADFSDDDCTRSRCVRRPAWRLHSTRQAQHSAQRNVTQPSNEDRSAESLDIGTIIEPLQWRWFYACNNRSRAHVHNLQSSAYPLCAVFYSSQKSQMLTDYCTRMQAIYMKLLRVKKLKPHSSEPANGRRAR